MLDLYHAYGSTLHREDWSLVCRSRGFDPHVIQPVVPADLLDEALVFDYRSIRRPGGVFNIRRRPGGAVDGYVFAVPHDGWSALDRKEGHPHRCWREIVDVVRPDGTRATAWTNRVIPAHHNGFCAPGSAYLAVCRAGRIRCSRSVEQLVAAAAGR